MRLELTKKKKKPECNILPFGAVQGIEQLSNSLACTVVAGKYYNTYNKGY